MPQQKKWFPFVLGGDGDVENFRFLCHSTAGCCCWPSWGSSTYGATRKARRKASEEEKKMQIASHRADKRYVNNLFTHSHSHWLFNGVIHKFLTEHSGGWLSRLKRVFLLSTHTHTHVVYFLPSILAEHEIELARRPKKRRKRTSSGRKLSTTSPNFFPKYKQLSCFRLHFNV